jgi:hypothetical protein
VAELDRPDAGQAAAIEMKSKVADPAGEAVVRCHQTLLTVLIAPCGASQAGVRWLHGFLHIFATWRGPARCRRVVPSTSTPPTPLQRLTGDPLHGTVYIRLRDRHRPVQPEHGWRVKGPPSRHCATCGMSWPCEVGQALKIVETLLVWLATRRA